MFFYQHQSKGFTLIELLVVISIIGLLSSVVLASLSTVRIRGRDARRIQDLQQIRLALNLYASANNGAYPAASYYSSWAGSGCYDWNDLGVILAPYLKTIPLDPTGHGAVSTSPCASAGSDKYWYAYLPSFQSASISAGNGAEGTCQGKALLFLNTVEGSASPKQDCQFVDIAGNPLKSMYPKAIIMLVN